MKYYWRFKADFQVQLFDAYHIRHHLANFSRLGQIEVCITCFVYVVFSVDGYYTVKMRGYEFQVWCVFSDTPVKAYMDISGVSRWGAGASHITPNYEITKTWNRARVCFDECLISLDRSDSTFGSDSRTFPTSGVHGDAWGAMSELFDVFIESNTIP